MKKSVLIGLSGGIDSAAVALDFIEKGYRVECITFLFSELTQNKVKAKSDNISAQLGLKTHIIDLRQVFKKNIEEYFAQSYKKGFTPNPCAMCNRLMKFPYLDKYREKLKIDYFSTGHYVNISNCIIKKSQDKTKDQSYFLAIVKPKHLKHFLISRNAYKTKDENRAYLKSKNIKMDYKSESQDICFIKNDYVDYLQKMHNFKKQRGEFIDNNNKILGFHDGYYYFTTGKRKGLKKGFNKRMYVKKIDAKGNRVYLVDAQNLKFKKMRVLLLERFSNNMENLMVKTRYRQKETKVQYVEIKDNEIICEFEEYQRDVTPGQIAVFYNNEYVVMSGIITEQL